MSFNTSTLDAYAENAGWTVRVANYWSHWSREYIKGQARILVRTVGDNRAHGVDRVTAVNIADGSGVIYIPKKNKKSEVLSALDAGRDEN